MHQKSLSKLLLQIFFKHTLHKARTVHITAHVHCTVLQIHHGHYSKFHNCQYIGLYAGPASLFSRHDGMLIMHRTHSDITILHGKIKLGDQASEIGVCPFFQGSGSGSVSGLDPYSNRSVDPGPDSYSESRSGFGSRRAKMTHKSRKKIQKFHVFTC